MKRAAKKRDVRADFRRKVAVSVVILGLIIVMMSIGPVFRVYAQAAGPAPQMSAQQADVTKFALVGAAIAFGLGAVGAGIAIGSVGAAAMGAIAEKPEIAGQALIFVALAEGLVVFGFVTALMILGRA